MQIEIHDRENCAGTCKNCQAQKHNKINSILVKSTNLLKVNLLANNKVTVKGDTYLLHSLTFFCNLNYYSLHKGISLKVT